MHAIRIGLTPAQRLDKAHAFVLDYPGLEPVAGVIMVGEYSVEQGLPTACTDGKNVRYGAEFIESISDPVLRFVILHEAFHKMFLHLIVWQELWERNPRLANMAMDYVINWLIYEIALKSNGQIELWEHALIDEKYKGMDVLEVFNLLEQEPPPEQPDQPGDGGGEGGQPGQPGQPMDDHDWENAKGMDPQEQEDVKKQIDDALRQGKMRQEQAGTGAGGPLDQTIDELTRVKTDWREFFWMWLRGQCKGNDRSTFRRPRRRFVPSGLYLPSTYSEKLIEIMVGTDTSGSMVHLHKLVRSHVAHILDTLTPEIMHYIEWDTSIESHHKIVEGQPDEMRTLESRGGGGTDVNCLASYLAKEKLTPKVLLIITDGHLSGSWGTWPKETTVLWAIVGNPNAKPDCGTVIHIDE